MSDAAENIDPNPPGMDPAGDPPAGDPPAGGAPEGPSIDKFETWADLEAGYKELEAFRGNSLRIPSEDAGQDAWNEFNEKVMQVPGMVRLPEEGDAEGMAAFRQRLGAPAEPNGYQFDEVDGFKSDPEDLGAFTALAHEQGLTRDQANAIYKHLAGNLAEADSGYSNELQESVGKLKGEWGNAFEHNFTVAKNAASALNERIPGIKEYFDGLDPNGLFDTNTVRLMAVVGEMMGESGAIDAGRPAGVLTPDEAMLQAQEIRDNPEHPYNNEMDPAHEAAKSKMADLYKMAYPNR